MISLVPLGDRAFLARFVTEDEAADWGAGLRALNWPGIIEVVTAYKTVGVYADPGRTDLDGLAGRLEALGFTTSRETEGRLVKVPVLYDGEDLPGVAQRLGITENRVVALHCAQDYRVFAIGFRPGFPYAGYLPEGLSGLARRESPRARVPAGSVAIAGQQTAVYPSDSPGGWHVIGRTPLRIVDVEQGHFPIRTGDRIRFVPVGSQEFEARRGELV